MSDKPPSETNTKVSNKEDEDTNKGPNPIIYFLDGKYLSRHTKQSFFI